MFSFGLDPNGSSQYILQWNRSQVYWSTGGWTGKSFSLAPDKWMDYFIFSFVSSENESYLSYTVKNNSSRLIFVLKYSGQIQQLSWLAGPWVWTLSSSRPESLSDVYALCGAFGVYNGNISGSCECPKGFEPFPMEDTSENDWSGGCGRKSPLQCENSTYANGKKDWFLKISNVRLPVDAKANLAVGVRSCELACMENCSCTAYSYASNGCLVWEGPLLNLQRLPGGGGVGQDIYLRLAADERPRTTGRTIK